MIPPSFALLSFVGGFEDFLPVRVVQKRASETRPPASVERGGGGRHAV